MVKIILIILNRLINNEHLVTKLAESYPMRRAAQFLVYFYNKNKISAIDFKNLAKLEGSKWTEKLKKIYEDLESQNKKLK